MSEPSELHVKRRRNAEETPEILILHADDDKNSEAPTRYRKKQKNAEGGKEGEQVPRFYKPLRALSSGSSASGIKERTPRVFQLQAATPVRVTGKRKGGEDGGGAVATFVEDDAGSEEVGDRRKKRVVAPDAKGEVKEEGTAAEVLTETFKRPGKGAALRKTEPTVVAANPETEAERRQVQALVDYMNEATLDETTRVERPRVVTAPKISGARARQLHEQRVASNGLLGSKKDVEMDSDDDFVTEVYVLAPSSFDSGVADMDDHDDAGIVGHLVIAKENRALWESYLEDTASDDGASDDEDENAEDYWGADYPEDEVDSDDEFDRNPHRYGPRDEEWDGDTGAWSDEDARMMDPFDKYRRLLQRATDNLQE